MEDETIGKKRMIHDASHGVRVNHRIRCRDKIRAPGAREKKTILRELRDREEVAFSVVGDISKARRRFKHAADEHGFLACQLEGGESAKDTDNDIIYVNKVGLRCLLRQLLVDEDCSLWHPSDTSFVRSIFPFGIAALRR